MEHRAYVLLVMVTEKTLRIFSLELLPETAGPHCRIGPSCGFLSTNDPRDVTGHWSTYSGTSFYFILTL